MKINTPVNHPDEVAALVEAGSDEFYCGYNPEDWSEKFSFAVWMNRRGPGPANISKFEDLQSIIEQAAQARRKVMVTMNAPTYTDEQRDFLKNLVDSILSIGGAGFILSDIALMQWVATTHPQAQVIVSSLAAVTNCASARFYQDSGASRIILPRQLSISEILHMKKNLPGLELEAFVMNDGCVYEESFCSTTHAIGAFCQDKWKYTNHCSNESGTNKISEKLFQDAIDDYQKRIWYLSNCGNTQAENGAPNGPCGLCAMYDFHEAGVEYLKVVGREATTHRKIKSVEMTHSVLQKIQIGADKMQTSEFAKSLRNFGEGCQNGYMCYYREPATAMS
ncbi:MAG: U32 family peptidase [Leptospirales bacterium]